MSIQEGRKITYREDTDWPPQRSDKNHPTTPPTHYPNGMLDPHASDEKMREAVMGYVENHPNTWIGKICADTGIRESRVKRHVNELSELGELQRGELVLIKNSKGRRVRPLTATRPSEKKR